MPAAASANEGAPERQAEGIAKAKLVVVTSEWSGKVPQAAENRPPLGQISIKYMVSREGIEPSTT